MATGVSKAKWQGKRTGQPAFETPTSDDTLTLSYAGKRTETEILTTIPAETQVLHTGNEPTDNRLYYGDNLPILAALLRDDAVRGKVRLIYIDPPFATKNVFQSRNQTDAYHDLRVGAQYIEFLRERLILLRELLAEDGSIYVHLDDNMAFHVKVIMDELLGARNFRNWITRKKCNPKNFTHKTYGNIADYLLFYTKSAAYVWNRPMEGWTDERAGKEYQYVEEQTGRRYKKVPIHAPGVRNGESGRPWRGMTPPPGKHWQYTPKTLDEMDARGEIYWSPTGNPRRKVYLDASDGVALQDIWLDLRDAHNQNIEITGYPTEKNPDLLARLINASSQPGDLVLDCFAGSGTTLAMAASLGRRWIGVDNSAEAITTTLRRFAHGRERMGDFVSQRAPSREQQAQQGQLTMATPSLFESATLEAITPATHQPIRDFSLYATTHYHGDLGALDGIL